jgi:serine/threonine protein kinase
MDGTPFGRYRLIELLGRGGMGEVWRAFDSETKRIVAIKVLPAHLADDKEFVQRFRREAEAAAQLNSPHVVPIHNYGEIDGRLYVDMRLIEGRDLQTVLVEGPLELARAVRIIEGVALALHAAHQVGLLHRDVKPSNILLDGNDFSYLIDFGISRAIDGTRMTKSGSTIGTFQYIAPERLDNQDEDARADIYSLACVLYECFAGDPPFGGDTMARLVAAHLNTPPPRPSIARPDVPAQVDEVIATGMAKDPDQRYATTIELADAARDAITAPIGLPAQYLSTRAASVASTAAPIMPATETAAPHRGADRNLAEIEQGPIGRPPAEAPTSSRKPWWPPRGRSGLIAATIVVVVVLVSGFVIFQLQQPSQPPAPSAVPTTQVAPPPPPPPPPPPKPIEEAALDGLLLTPDQINTAVGATGLTIAGTWTTMGDNSARISDKACLFTISTDEVAAYAGSGFSALRTQGLHEPGDGLATATHNVGQSVVLFSSAHDADAFFTASAQSWPACANRQYTIAGDTYTVGPVSNTNGTLSAIRTRSSDGQTCQFALTVANNVAIDTDACSKTAFQSDSAVNIAHQIAAKVRTT